MGDANATEYQTYTKKYGNLVTKIKGAKRRFW